VTTKQWALIGKPLPEMARSGHVAVAFGGRMYVFGGILEVTKELNDLLVYDFKTQKMSIMDKNGDPFEIPNFAKGVDDSAIKGQSVEGNSPIARGKTFGASPNRKGGASPTKRGTMGAGSPNTSALGKSPTKKPSMLGSSTAAASDDKGLSSPTSISMQNSFIIKNADESFDLYYQQMKRRRHVANFQTNNEQTFASPSGKQALSPATTSITGFQRNRKPQARDGHSACVDKFGFMFVFGGDRHQMPFNDLYFIKLPK
jgi:hypothetical protein